MSMQISIKQLQSELLNIAKAHPIAASPLIELVQQLGMGLGGADKPLPKRSVRMNAKGIRHANNMVRWDEVGKVLEAVKAIGAINNDDVAVLLHGNVNRLKVYIALRFMREQGILDIKESQKSRGKPAYIYEASQESDEKLAKMQQEQGELRDGIYLAAK